MIPLNVWIGYDPQFESNHTAQLRSIRVNGSDANVTYLKLNQLGHVLTRPRDPLQSTDSAFTRWLIPYLSNYQGWHLYMDSDMLVCKDLYKLLDLCDESKAVMVVKHQQKPNPAVKFKGYEQTSYNRKNWSSLMLFNSALCKDLTPEYVNGASGLDLHQFAWLDDSLIGELPPEWNHLVGIDKPRKNPAIIHWTLGGPWFKETKQVEHHELWQQLNK